MLLSVPSWSGKHQGSVCASVVLDMPHCTLVVTVGASAAAESV